MKNEYGTEIDRNGYAQSLLSTPGCYFCGRLGDIYHRNQRHEIFHGSLFRERSKNLGCWVTLCPECHRMLHQTTPAMDRHLKEAGQRAAMIRYGWSLEDFRKRFGKNYLGGD